jgi:ATP-dependent DNA helicase RecG
VQAGQGINAPGVPEISPVIPGPRFWHQTGPRRSPTICEGCLFTATVHRREVGGSEKSSPKSSPKIIELMRQNPAITVPEIAQHGGVTDRMIKNQIEKLKIQGRIRRIGPARGGHPEVIA